MLEKSLKTVLITLFLLCMVCLTPLPAGAEEPVQAPQTGGSSASEGSAQNEERTSATAITLPDDEPVPTSAMTPQDDGRIPTATVMLQDTAPLVLVNAAIGSFSLVVSGVSLVLTRPRRQSTGGSFSVPAEPDTPFLALSFLSIGLGAVSAVLFVLSQQLTQSPLEIAELFTPLLIAISLVQLACAIALFVKRRRARKNEPPRLNIRY